jgi:hypothetical protein
MRRPLPACALLLLGLATAAPARQRQEIRDASCRLVGTISVSRNGVREGRDRNCRLVGRYDPKTNETRDSNYRLVSRGDTLPALVWAARSAR